ncbi:MAG TPA: M14 family zinc carboxypeptidase [Solirubrobacteraceae bacterium]|nr:M14 family zinc carboxypeptidase [Solirubrobacteraceae bacterium]
MRQRRHILLAVAAAALAAPGAAHARPTAAALPLIDAAPVRAAEAVARTCFARPLAAGTAGADVRVLAAPATGFLQARLDGAPGGADWDLAVFDGAGRLLGASAAFGGREVVRAAVTAGDRVTVQACRYGGAAEAPAPRLSVEGWVVSGAPARAPVDSLVSIRYRGRRQFERLTALGLDLNEIGRDGRIDAVLHGARDARRLRAAGFRFRVRIKDLAAWDRRHLNRRVRPSARPLPSGRTSYRSLVDYEMDMKRLVDEHPNLVRPVILPKASVEGRTIAGIEIADDVHAPPDGRPVHVEMGLHHVREWPSGEVVAEFAFDLAKGHGRDPRITDLLRRTRTFLFPVINPDGLAAAQRTGTATTPADDDLLLTLPLIVSGTGSYRRKNCAPGPGQVNALPCELKDGVDLNRNYGAFWGGPGSGDTWADQTFRGPAPFSEPEAEAVHQWSSRQQVMVLNSHHTFAGTVLYQPGFSRKDEPGLPRGTKLPYESRMIALAKAMAAAAGYEAMYSYELYDVTGATEDWNYFAQGAFGYTTEVGYGNFHPEYESGVVHQYLGAPGTGQKGLRESMLLAGEAAADPDNHALIAGAAPAGRVLRLTKDFQTPTSYVLTGEGTPSEAEGDPILIPEHFETTLTVPASGRYEWHVNPSTRPLVLLAGGTEAWTLTCEDASGRVLETQQVVVGMAERGVRDLPCGGTLPPSGGDGAAATPRLRIRSARPARGGRRVVAALRATGATRLTRLRATLRDARGRVRASTRRARTRPATRIVLRARRQLRRGRYVLKVTARTPAGTPLSATRRLRVR